MEPHVRDLLIRQQNRMAGKHSAVKICAWTKNSIRGNGFCYKQKFYGIMSHRCVQMSPSVGHCHNRCIFCWRPIEYTDGPDFPEVDQPSTIIDQCLLEQKNLLMGFGGNDKVDKQKLKEALEPRHFAISLTGEPTLYPKLNNLIQELHERGFSTFLVTNGMEPLRLKRIIAPTQLYLSVDAPNKELFEIIDQPMVPDAWDRLQESVGILKSLSRKTRTCLRLTMIKGMNMVYPAAWAKIIRRARPMFVEVKAYMHVGYSKKRLVKENMPTHAEVMDFSKKIAHASGYSIIDEHRRSRVSLLMENDVPGRIMEFS